MRRLPSYSHGERWLKSKFGKLSKFHFVQSLRGNTTRLKYSQRGLIVSWKATFKCRSKHGHSQATNYCDSDLAFARITWEMPLNLGRKTPRENWRKIISGRQFSFSETWWTVQCPYARNLPSSSSDARIPCPRETSEKSNIYTRRHARKINFMF